jgi:hypothetical protein
MATGSGVAAQVGMAAETTYGTYVAPTRWIEWESAEPDLKPERYQGGGLNAGLLVDRDSRYVEVQRQGTLKLEGDVLARGFGPVLKQIFGTLVGPTQQGATAAWLQTHTLSDLGGVMSTQQIGIPDALPSATVRPYTCLGCKVTEAEFSCEAGKQLKLSLTLDVRDIVESQTLVAATFSAAGEQPFHWGGLAVKAAATAGSEAAVDGVAGWSLKISRKMKDDRFYANNAGLKSEPLTADRVMITGEIQADYVDKTLWADRFAANSGFSLVAAFTGDLIATPYSEQITFATPRCRLTGSTPQVGGLDVVSGKFPFEVKYDNTNPPITCTYQTIDTTL